VPDDQHGGNFCEFFQIGDGVNRGGPDKASLLSAAEALFKK
jgi:hypothetical protein